MSTADDLSGLRRDLHFSAAEIERATGLPRGVISAVECGRLYAYPRLRHAVASFLASETGESYEEMHDRLFPSFAGDAP